MQSVGVGCVGVGGGALARAGARCKNKGARLIPSAHCHDVRDVEKKHVRQHVGLLDDVGVLVHDGKNVCACGSASSEGSAGIVHDEPIDHLRARAWASGREATRGPRPGARRIMLRQL